MNNILVPNCCVHAGDNVTLENFKTKDHTTEGAEEDMSHELHHKGVPLLGEPLLCTMVEHYKAQHKFMV